MKIDLKELFGKEEGLNDEMMSVIIKAIKDNYQSDIDYLKFKQSVTKLQEMNIDEPTSIKSAFMTLSTMGVTKKRILESIRHYSNVVNKEKDKFAIALKNQITNHIEKPKLEADKFDDMIDKNQREIEKLQKEIDLINQRKLTIGDELSAAEAKINVTRDEFRAVYEFYAKTLDNDKILIDQILD